MTAAKKTPTKTAAIRHHTDPPHAKERDIDLNAHYSDPELKVLLKLLRPMLERVIKASERCNKKNPDQGAAVGNYHNITVCDGRH